MTEPPFQEDFFQRIVNVNWGGDVIVVFVDGSVFDPQPVFSYSLLKDSVKFLSSWYTPYQAGGFQPGFKCTAYKVPSNAGEFISSTTPGFPGEGVQGFWTDAYVFAIEDSDIERSLQRAIDGTKLIVPAIYLNSHTDSDIPWDMAPPGLLWNVETGAMDEHQVTTWKMRYGDHRGGARVDPPNKMVQCYPLGQSFYGWWGSGRATWTGYIINAYRLDKPGTGIVYGRQQGATGGNQQNIDPAWAQLIILDLFGATVYGIPFNDPPPLISADLV